MANSPTLYAPKERDKPNGKVRPDSRVARYMREVERYKRSTESWYAEGDEIVKVYLDENRDNSRTVTTRKLALLWANVETLKPAVYGRIPQVVCSRRYKDKDPIGRVCAELMERATNTTFDLYAADETFRMVRDDRLLPGRGQAWVRYEALLGKYQDKGDDGEPKVDEQGQPVYREKLKDEKVCTDYVHWRDFGHNVARSWADVWIVWRCVYKTQDEVVERWGSKIGASLQYSHKPPASATDTSSVAHDDAMEDCCKIFEFWDKRAGITSWLADGQREFLESGKPPIDFRNGFPCPEPCYATKTGKQLRPVPDYRYYRDQAMEINDLTAKIANLTDWLIVKGFIPGAPSGVADPIEEILRDKGNKELFATVTNWGEWTEKGGAAKLIDWLPVDKVILALQAAIATRKELINDVFVIMGVGDTLRGESDPRKTRGAVELESQTGSRRLKNTRDELARWCKDIAMLTAEVIAEKFEPENIASITGYKYQPQPVMQGLGGLPGIPGQEAPMPTPQGGMGLQMQQPAPNAPLAMGSGGPPVSPTVAPAAATGGVEEDAGLVFDDRHIALLRDDKLRSFRIEVETDITSQADENMEKERWMEFLTVTGGYLEKAVAVVGAAPALGDPAKELLMATARRFRAGKGIEESLDRGFTQAVQQAKQAAQQGDPKVAAEKAKAEIAAGKAKADADLAQAKAQSDAQLAQAKAQSDAQLAEAKAGHEAMLAKFKVEKEVELAHFKAAQDAKVKEQETTNKRQDADEKLSFERKKHDDSMVFEQEKLDREMLTKGGVPKGTHDGGVAALVKEAKAARAETKEAKAEAAQLRAEIGKLMETARKPTKVRRGKDGRATHIETGFGTLAVQRGPDGRAVGLG